MIDMNGKTIVYKLFHKNKLVYIGQTINLQSRLENHLRSKVFDAVSYLIVDTVDADAIEAYLIIENSPPLNKTVVHRLFPEGKQRFLSKYSDIDFFVLPSIPVKRDSYRKQPKTSESFSEDVRDLSYIPIPMQLIGGCCLKNVDNSEQVFLSYIDILIIACMHKSGVSATQDKIAEDAGVDRKTVNRLFSKTSAIVNEQGSKGKWFMDFNSLLQANIQITVPTKT